MRETGKARKEKEMSPKHKRIPGDGNVQPMGDRYIVEKELERKPCLGCGREMVTRDNFDYCRDCLEGGRG